MQTLRPLVAGALLAGPLFAGVLVAGELVASCKARTSDLPSAPARPLGGRADASGGSASGASAPGVADAATAAGPCTPLGTARLAEKPELGSLQNVRVAADERGALVTWERLSVPQLGDSSQLGVAAFVDGRTDAVTTVVLPARAYAAAVYTSLAPTRVEGALDLFTYGVAGGPSFALYGSGPGPWKGVDVFQGSGPAAKRLAQFPVAVQESLAVAAGRPLAIVGGAEGPCESYYTCEEKYAPAMRRGLVKSVRSVALDQSKPYSEVLYRGTSAVPAKPFAPAIAVGSSAALAAYRVDAHLEGVWLTLHGKKERSFPLGAEGDVGAPALTFAGDRAYAAWAARASSAEPYRLWVAMIGAAGVEAAGYVDTGAESAFAPALAAREGELVVAWMEGNDGTRGRVRLGFLPLERVASSGSGRLALRATVDASGEGNHLDPELAIAGDRLYLAWSDFGAGKADKAKKDGVAVLATLRCR